MRFEDTEWNDAIIKGGKEMYWWIYPQRNRKDIKYVKRYNKAIAALLAKRAGWEIEPIFGR